jgi:galactokinase
MIERLLAAEGALSRDELDQAQRLFGQVAEADPRNAIAVVGLARVLARRGDTEAARELLAHALQIDPDEAAAHRLLAELEAGPAPVEAPVAAAAPRVPERAPAPRRVARPAGAAAAVPAARLSLDPSRMSPSQLVARAPGRVNLIGEHTDYNDGLVLPMAIDLETRIDFTPTDDGIVDLVRTDIGERVLIDLRERATPETGRRGDWTDYVAGTAWALRLAGGRSRGLFGLLSGDLPIGQGLSSSAALELACAWALSGGTPPLAKDGRSKTDPMAVARACQRAENEFVGVPCGILDQFAVAFGVRDAALLLDCRSLEHRPVPLPPGAAFLIAESGVKRELRGSGYEQRRRECEAAAAALAEIDPSVHALRDATPELLEHARDRLDDRLFRRARHVATENERVLATVRAFEAGDLPAAGRAFLASHASLRDDFDVSVPALDRLVEVAAAIPGVYGARLTGGGFGGAVLVLAEAGAATDVAAGIRAGYRIPSGDAPVVRAVRAREGAGLVAVPGTVA